jgi:hypothetical protein
MDLSVAGRRRARDGEFQAAPAWRVLDRGRDGWRKREEGKGEDGRHRALTPWMVAGVLQLETTAWGKENAGWLEANSEWSLVAPLALEAMDAVIWVARLLDARVQIDATFSGNDTLAADIRCGAGHATMLSFAGQSEWGVPGQVHGVTVRRVVELPWHVAREGG